MWNGPLPPDYWRRESRVLLYSERRSLCVAAFVEILLSLARDESSHFCSLPKDLINVLIKFVASSPSMD